MFALEWVNATLVILINPLTERPVVFAKVPAFVLIARAQAGFRRII